MLAPLRPEPRSSIKALDPYRRWTSRGERRTGTASRRTGVALVAIMHARSTASHVQRALVASSTHALAVLTLVQTPMKGHELLAGMAYSAIYGVRHSPLSSIGVKIIFVHATVPSKLANNTCIVPMHGYS